MTRPAIYQKNFSQLPGLQEKKTISYSLVVRQTAGQPHFGIRVTETSPYGVACDETYFFPATQAQAEDLLTYLYENAVPAAQFASVIFDATTAIKWEDDHGPYLNSTANCG